MRRLHRYSRAEGKATPTLDSYKGKPKQSYYYLPILPKFDCSAFNSGTKENKIEAINKYIRNITAQFGRLSHNIKANDGEKESFYRPHYNYNLAQRNLAYQCKSAIEYGQNVESIKYTAPKPPTPPPTPTPKPKPKPSPPKDEVPKPKPPPIPTPMGGGGGGGFIEPSFCDINPDSPKCTEGGEATNGVSDTRTTEPKKGGSKLLLIGLAAAVGYLILVKK